MRVVVATTEVVSDATTAPGADPLLGARQDTGQGRLGDLDHSGCLPASVRIVVAPPFRRRRTTIVTQHNQTVRVVQETPYSPIPITHEHLTPRPVCLPDVFRVSSRRAQQTDRQYSESSAEEGVTAWFRPGRRGRSLPEQPGSC
jgi:hypothetical protein